MGRFRCPAVSAALGCVVFVGAIVTPVGAGVVAVPEAVSPAAGRGEVRVEARCPTFSWAGVRGARGYELVVLAVPAAGADRAAEPRVVSRATIPGEARAWTPSLGSCLERAGHYAWSVRAVTDEGGGEWSRPALFRVTTGPSVEEVEAAMETLRRHLADRQAAGPLTATAAETDGPSLPPGDQRLAEALTAARGRRAVGGGESAARVEAPGEEAGMAALPLDGTATPTRITAAAAPTLGDPSLSVSANVALGGASNVFKDGEVFLWDDTTSGNTALGRSALAAASGDATNNTAVGREALESTTTGADFFHGSNNTAVGDRALLSNSTGFLNTASGAFALVLNSTGDHNTASGARALFSNTIGSYNAASGTTALTSNTSGSHNTASGAFALRNNDIGNANTAVGFHALRFNTRGNRNAALGYKAGYNVTGEGTDDNIFISNEGLAADANKIRIGTQGTQDGTFIAGIRGVTTGTEDGVPVLIDSAGQLGTVSSSRAVKQDIREIGELSERLQALRAVAFRYKRHAENDPDGPLQFGLIAEEVAEVFPDLVVYGADGQPQTIRYHLLSSLLLNELQREHQRGLAQERDLAALRARVLALEAGEARPAPQRRSRWRRSGDRDAP